jgi:hypothetical protein
MPLTAPKCGEVTVLMGGGALFERGLCVDLPKMIAGPEIEKLAAQASVSVSS